MNIVQQRSDSQSARRTGPEVDTAATSVPVSSERRGPMIGPLHTSRNRSYTPKPANPSLKVTPAQKVWVIHRFSSRGPRRDGCLHARRADGSEGANR